MLLLLHSVLLLLVLVVASRSGRSVSNDRSRLRRDRANRAAITSSAAITAVTSVTVSVSTVSVMADRFGFFGCFIPDNPVHFFVVCVCVCVSDNKKKKREREKKEIFRVDSLSVVSIHKAHLLLATTVDNQKVLLARGKFSVRASQQQFRSYFSAVTLAWSTRKNYKYDGRATTAKDGQSVPS